MRYSRITLLSSLSAFALMAASATSSQAFMFGGGNDALKPRSAWQVGPIDAASTSYCAMVNQFDQDVSLAFARSPGGNGSLAINVPDKNFETGKMYDLMLQVDKGEARRYSVRATGPSSLIVQVGQDDSLYSALAQNGILRVVTPSMDMKFKLGDFSGSYLSMANCLSTLPQQRGDGPKTAALPVTSVEKTSLPGGLAEEEAAAHPVPALQTRIAEKTVQYDILQKRFETAEQDRQTAASTAQRLQTDLGKDLALLKAEKDNLESRYAALKLDSSATANDLRRKLEEKNIQYDVLQKQYDRIEKERHSAHTELAGVSQQKDDLAARLESQSQQDKMLFTKLQEQLSKARQQVSMLETQLMEVALQKGDYATRLEEQTRQNKMLQISLEAVQRELYAVRNNTGPIASAAYPVTASFQPAIIGPDSFSAAKISSGDRGYLPAITPPKAASSESSLVPRIKAFISGNKSSSGKADQGWETIVVQ
jgi:hypothetical protein